MISASVLAAVIDLQQRALRSSDGFEIDRFERALDELLRNPKKTTPAAFQQRSALANAGKIAQARRLIAPTSAVDISDMGGEHVGVSLPTIDGAVDEMDIHLWLETTPSLNCEQRTLLRALASGEDANSLACRTGVSVQRMREQISRARRTGWTAYQREVGQ